MSKEAQNKLITKWWHAIRHEVALTSINKATSTRDKISLFNFKPKWDKPASTMKQATLPRLGSAKNNVFLQ